MIHLWLPTEDLLYNHYALLTPADVYERFVETIGAYNTLEDFNKDYKDPEILMERYIFSQEEFTPQKINTVVKQLVKKLNDSGYSVSYENVKPLLRKLKIKERRHLVVETPKGFVQFMTEDFRQKIDSPLTHKLSYETLPRFENK